MPRFGRNCAIATLVTWVCLVPDTAQAASITFVGTLDPPNEVEELATFDVLTSELLTVTLSSGFDPILSLFLVGDAAGPNTFLTDSDQSDFFGDGVTLEPGKYLLTLSQWPNYFEPAFGAFAVTDPGFFLAELGCDYSVASGDCGTSDFSGNLALQTVPEPATLSLVVIGASALWGRRIRQHRPGNPRRRPSP